MPARQDPRLHRGDRLWHQPIDVRFVIDEGMHRVELPRSLARERRAVRQRAQQGFVSGWRIDKRDLLPRFDQHLLYKRLFCHCFSPCTPTLRIDEYRTTLGDVFCKNWQES
jgi:hypothetical protein